MDSENLEKHRKEKIKFIHYTENPFKFNPFFKYYISGPFYSKPDGLWFSVEGLPNDINWKEWCHQEEFRIKNLTYLTEIYFCENSNILWLKNRKEIKEFEKNFIFVHPMLKIRYDVSKSFVYNPKYHKKINWEQVKKKWDGIIIAPFNDFMRWNCVNLWYDPWDCASGCIWNLESIKDVSESYRAGEVLTESQ